MDLYVRTFVVGVFVAFCVLRPSSGAAQSLPSGWTAADIGAPAVQGAATFNGTFQVRGAGEDIWGASDQFTFVYRQLTGDGNVVARVTSIANTAAWAKAGVMIRESLSADAPHALMTASAGKGLAFQRRSVKGMTSAHTPGGAGTVPVWVKLERRGSTIRAFRSADGAAWTLIGEDIITMVPTVFVGLAVTSHNTNQLTEGLFASVAVTPVASTPPGPLPSGWTSADIGPPQISGSAGYANGTYTVKAGGRDIWSDSDEFHYVYRAVQGDTNIVARVAAVEDVDMWTKAGVMIRDALTPNAAHFSLFVSSAKGIAFQRRPTAGGATRHNKTGSGGAPFWVKLERRGNQITAFQSGDGSAWVQVGTGTLTLPNVYIGLAVTSHNAGKAATALFDSVRVGTPANQPPSISLTAPADQAVFTAPASVNVAATASDNDGTVARVDFYSGATLIGSDTTAPFGFTWSGVPAGTHQLKAIATDNGGATAESATRTITVRTPVNLAPTVSLTAPADGATFTAPANITVSATAGDPDGTVTAVDFFAGTTLVGSDSSAPYSVTWTNAAAGTYAVTAVARDNGGASTTSAARTVFVTSPLPGLPPGWTAADIGQPAIAGSTQYSNGTYTVNGAGVDVWDRSDQFQFVYRQFTGDIEITSRVMSLENTNVWAKAGVMIRQTLAADSVQVSLVVTPGQGTNFYRRLTTGDVTQPGPTGPSTAPYWVRLVRRGTLVTAFQSSDGATWTSVGTMTLATATMYVGLEVTSHDPTQAATAVFDNVVVRTPLQAPTVSLTAPADGATFPSASNVTVSATASDADGSIVSVSFYAGTTLIGTDSTSPYSVTWSNVPDGAHSLTAVARDNDGATTTSAARSIRVGNPPTLRRAVFTPSSNHNTVVQKYVLKIFTSTANPDTATPVATQDLGKPAVVAGECSVDVSQTVQGLAAGTYIATVTAVGASGSTASAPSPAFTR